MVQRLDANDLRLERVFVLVHVSDEVELRRRGPDDQDLVGAGERDSDFLEEAFGARVVTLLFGLSCQVVVRRFDLARLEALGLDMEELCFFVIDPNGDVTDARGGRISLVAPVWDPFLDGVESARAEARSGDPPVPSQLLRAKPPPLRAARREGAAS